MPGGDSFDKYQQSKFKKSVAKARSKGIDSRSNKPKKTNQEKKTGKDYAASGDAAKDYEASKPVVVRPDKYGLEALLSNKDKLQNIPANDGTGRNMYQVEIEKIKNTPGGLAAFKEKYPNPLVKIAQGIGKFFKEGTFLGKLLSSLNKSDQNKLKTIQNEQGGVKIGPPAYDVNQYGLGGFYEDKILRDLNLKNRLAQQLGPEGLTLNTAGMNEGIMAGAEPYDPQATYRRKVVEKYYGASGNISQAAIDKAYNQIISNMKKSETNMEGPYSYQAGYPEGDYSNFQEQIVDEVTEKNIPGANEDNMMDSENIFELGSDNLAGSVSETAYSAPNIEGTNPRGEVSSARSTPLIGGNPNVPYGYEENILDVLAEDNMANGGYMKSFPNQNLNIESLSASDNIDDRIMKNLQFEKMSPGMMGYNQGGKVMSTYDKLKAIADNNYG